MSQESRLAPDRELRWQGNSLGQISGGNHSRGDERTRRRHLDQRVEQASHLKTGILSEAVRCGLRAGGDHGTERVRLGARPWRCAAYDRREPDVCL